MTTQSYFILGMILFFICIYGVIRNLKKFFSILRKDSAEKTFYVVEGLFFGTTPLFLLLGITGLAFISKIFKT